MRLDSSARKPRRKLEAELQEAATQLLELDGWRAIRTDPVSDAATVQAIRAKLAARGLLTPAIAECIRSRGKGFGEVGMADMLYIRYRQPNASWGYVPDPGDSQALWIEFKSPTGKPTLEQLAWMQAEQRRGALVWLAGRDFPATIDGFAKHYNESGLAIKRLTVR